MSWVNIGALFILKCVLRAQDKENIKSKNKSLAQILVY
ncbi:hypothetical protein JCM19301_304 [Jejuia pallidilutea]|uniref:Uncharacterized protein n=1 Tax=Jejuia pallidilutea TaxID=504487 RepID=A0A090WL18_9FLAO|nr:hypothetical protein JCM19301_304 [Jejuia pallidilutea]GAL89917.1 hypothetical protein JCM19538_1567 [Jejuia pallidilutea]